MKYIVAEVRLSELHVQPVVVAPWEFKILKAMHPEGSVNQTGTQDVETDPPNAFDEFARLEARYQLNGDEPSMASQVYGLHESGITALAKEIQRAAKVSEQSAG